jgi:hypothetical protein
MKKESILTNGETEERNTDEPHQAIWALFDFFGLKGAREDMQCWLESAFSEEFSWKRGSPGNLLFFYDYLHPVIETANQIYLERFKTEDQKKNSSANDFVSPLFIEQISLSDKLPYRNNFPILLQIEEWQNPYLVLKDFFEFLDLDEWNDEIYQLLHAGLSNHSFLDIIEPEMLLPFCMKLQKLIEAMYLIFLLEYGNPEKGQDGSDSKHNENAPKKKNDLNDAIHDGVTNTAEDNTTTQSEINDATTERENNTTEEESKSLGKRVRLIDKVITDPYSCIAEVFRIFGVDDISGVLQFWPEVAMRNESSAYENARDRGDLMDFCRELQLLAEALHVINEKNKIPGADDWKEQLPEDLKEKIKKFDQPELQDSQQTENPSLVVKDFCNTFTINYARVELWDLLDAVISYEKDGQKYIAGLNLLLTYECLLCIIKNDFLLPNQ